MNRDKLYVKNILECIRRVEEDTQGGKPLFFSNRTIQDAVVRNLQIMAESTKRLSDPSKATHTEIPWQQIAQFRNRVVHDYINIDFDKVWQIIINDVPALKLAISDIQSKIP